MAQLLEVSFRAVTKTEYLWATEIVIKSVGDSSTSVWGYVSSDFTLPRIYALTPSTSMIFMSWPSIQK